MLTTVVLLVGSASMTLAQWSPYGFQQRPIMGSQFGGFGGGPQFGGMPGFPHGGSSIRFAPQTFGGSGQGGFGGQFGGPGSGQFPGSGSPFGGNEQMMGGGGMGGMGGSSFPPYGQQSAPASQLVLPPGALSGPGFGSSSSGFGSGSPFGSSGFGGAGQGFGSGSGMGSPFSSSIDNSITSMNSLNNVPFGGAGNQQQGFPGSGAGFPGSSNAATSGVRRIIPPFLQGADQATEDRNTYEQFRREAASTQKTKRDKVHGLVEQMSPEAQQQFQKVSALMTNPGLSDQDRLQQISELYNKLSPQVRSEFDAKFTGL